MRIEQEEVTSNIDMLLKVSLDFEQRMLEAGILEAHDWMFALREVLYDLRRLNILVASLFNSSDVGSKGPQLLQEIVQTLKYEVVPHVESHMNELEQALENYLPKSE